MKKMREFLIGPQSRRSIQIIGVSGGVGIVSDFLHATPSTCVLAVLACVVTGVLLSTDVLFS